MMDIVCLLLALFYCLMIAKSLRSMPRDAVEIKTIEPSKKILEISLIIPFRNEGKNLPHLLAQIESLLPQSQLKEVILVDDHSKDGGPELVHDFIQMHPEKVKYVLSKGEASKKGALHSGIIEAEFEWVLISDADSEFPSGWIASMTSIPESDLLVGPVLFYAKKKSFIGTFQVLDSIALLGIGQSAVEGGTPLFASASNLLFRKSDYLELNPFLNNWNIPSGDDVFLLQSFANAGRSIKTIWHPHALVQSEAPKTLSKMLKQKLRWASKNPLVPSMRYQFTAFSVLFFNVSLIAGIALAVYGLIATSLLVAMWVVKLVLDYLVLRRLSNVYRKTWSLFDFLSSFLIYPLYVTFIGILSFFYTPKWK
ncbi:MAG TPA: hypothetical protein DCS15_03095 [Flavobacteriales bacterium]|nr:hypothetical protein [Flavobacteriales bacterium]